MEREGRIKKYFIKEVGWSLSVCMYCQTYGQMDKWQYLFRLFKIEKNNIMKKGVESKMYMAYRNIQRLFMKRCKGWSPVRLNRAT